MIARETTARLAMLAAFCCASPARAEGVNEVNYLHIEREISLAAMGHFRGSNLGERSVETFGRLSLAAGLQLSDTGVLTAGSAEAPAGSTTLSILSEEDICTVGVAVTHHGETNRIQVTFEFLRRDGSLVEQETRWPASGTTLQAFSVDTEDQRFAAVRITAQVHATFSVSNILAVECKPLVS